MAGTEIRVLGTELFLAEKFANKVWLFQEAFVLTLQIKLVTLDFQLKSKQKDKQIEIILQNQIIFEDQNPRHPTELK